MKSEVKEDFLKEVGRETRKRHGKLSPPPPLLERVDFLCPADHRAPQPWKPSSHAGPAHWCFLSCGMWLEEDTLPQREGRPGSLYVRVRRKSSKEREKRAVFMLLGSVCLHPVAAQRTY